MLRKKRKFLIVITVFFIILLLPIINNFNISKVFQKEINTDENRIKPTEIRKDEENHEVTENNRNEEIETGETKKTKEIKETEKTVYENHSNNSIGKFYKYNIKPDNNYSDIYMNEFTDGTKLTDGEYTEKSNLNNYVAWNEKEVEIILDLGKVTSISSINICYYSNSSKNIKLPNLMSMQISSNMDNWLSYGTDIDLTSKKVKDDDRLIVEGNGGLVNARYIKYKIAKSTGYTMIGEIWTEGEIVNSKKKIPQDDCYHGAYAESDYLNGWMDINDYENLTKRELKMSLWYANWNTEFNKSVKDVILNNLKDKNIFLELGFLPYNTTSYDIATGKYDYFLKNWFIECKNLNYPIWIRPMNEMNGAWTFKRENPDNELIYGGDPKNYKKAWRRMYNIAEQVGATGENQIFLWSPDARSEEGHNFSYYYPGDQYVDWVGVSAYVDKVNNNGEFDSLDSLLDEIYEKYNNIKPFMISEGGAYEVKKRELKADWIRQWFNITQKKNIKALVWFHRHDVNSDGIKSYGTRIDSSLESINAYRP